MAEKRPKGKHLNRNVPRYHPWRISSYGNLEKSLKSGYVPGELQKREPAG